MSALTRSPYTRVRGEDGERERATLRAGLCSEETGRISCSAKRETLPEGLPPIDPALLPPFSLLDRFVCRSSVFLPFSYRFARIYRETEEKPVDEKRMCAIYSFFLMLYPPRSPVLPPSYCSHGKPIAGNTSLGSDRKEGRKEGKTRNRGIVTTPCPREHPLCWSCCSFGGEVGATTKTKRGRMLDHA